jgi:uncharacterized delta-60 repeat protein
MQESTSPKGSHLLSVSIRLGLPPALGILTVLLLIGLMSVASPSLTPAAPPAPGDLDVTFGTTGVVTTPIGPGEDAAAGIAIQSDGRIVAAGYAHNGSDFDFAVVRYTGSGTLDTTFGASGVVTTSIGPGDEWARDVAIQSDGKIVAAGHAYNGSDYDFAVVRYTSSGDLDTSFGSGGVVTTPIGSGDDWGRGVAIQPDGKIVAAGYAHSGSDHDFAVVRYTGSGTLDASFGNTGVVTTRVSAGDDRLHDVAIQPDGSIVVAGLACSGSDHDFAVARYTTSGALDTSFGSTGVVTTFISPSNDAANAVAIQSDGKIVAAGHAYSGSEIHVTLARYNTSGTLDTSFGSTGVVTTPIGVPSDYANDVVIQPDGRIVAAGYAYGVGNQSAAVVRYTPSGALDTGFGSGGVVTTPIGTGEVRVYGVAIQSDGKIVTMGSAYSGSDRDFAVVRYHGRYSVYLPLVLRSSQPAK